MGKQKEELPTQAADTDCPYSVVPSRLNEINGSKDMEALSSLGGVEGLGRAIGSDIRHGLAPSAAAGPPGTSSVEEHQRVYGANRYKEQLPKNFFMLCYENMQDPIILLLCAAALVSTALGAALPEQREQNEWIEGVAIWMAVIIVIMVGAGNDYQKDQQFRKLNAAKDTIEIKVIRGGETMLRGNHDIVVGDVVLLDTGDKIIADGLVIDSHGLVVDEASLTGESEPIRKALDEDPWCRSGTTVTEGSGRMLITAVGPQSEWGKTMALVGGAGDDETPLQEKLTDLAGAIGKVGCGVAVACFIALIIKWCVFYKGFPVSRINNNGPVQFFLYAVTIVVVAVPEGLPLAVTISLAYSMKKMMKDNNFVRVLAACETMGGATAICSDKTGTLTENRMTVTEGWFSGVKMDHPPTTEEMRPELIKELQFNIALNSKAFLQEENGVVDFVGNRTDCALLMMLRKWGRDYKQTRDEADPNIVEVYNFSSAKKMASVLVRQPGRLRLYNKGAAEWVLKRCVSFVNEYGEIAPMTDQAREEMVGTVVTGMASRGLRCICLTYRDFPSEDSARAEDFFADSDRVDRGLTCMAIVGIKDPVRKEVPAAVATVQHAGLTVRMVTGDNIHTARHIARECGILTDDGIAMEGPTFRAMPAADLIPLLPRLQVLARSSPEDKLTLVSLLKKEGDIVAVTGDGTNDAPALKESDVGLAMGIAGTEVAKEAADIVILDDNFTSIVKSVLWGRSVFANIRKFLQFQLTVNFVALVIAFIGAVVGGRIPLNVLQLLWVNLIMDTMGALALATEVPNPSLLNEQPHGRDAPLINMRMWKHIVVQGCYQMFWLFFFMYALPSLVPYYNIVTECELYANGGEIDANPMYCLQSAKDYGLNQTSSEQYCNYLTSCGMPCGSSQSTSCSLSALYPAPQQVPSDSAKAICNNTGGGCAAYSQFIDFQEHMSKEFDKEADIDWKQTASLLFNTFIFLQLANEINARRINDEINVFSGLFTSHIFLGVIVVTVLLQVIIMEALGSFFKVVRPTWQEWLVAIAIGVSCIPVSILTRVITQLWEGRIGPRRDLSKVHNADGEAHTRGRGRHGLQLKNIQVVKHNAVGADSARKTFSGGGPHGSSPRASATTASG